MRLIDADALMTWFNDHYDDEQISVGVVSGLIKDTPTIDAVEALREISILAKPSNTVEVVRCGECRHWEGEERNGFYYFETCSRTKLDALSDDFCSYGEREGE